MKTICSLLVTLLIAASVATADNPHAPTLIVTCPGGTAGGCSQPEFIATNLDPSTTYVIEGTGPNEIFDVPGVTSAPDGTFDSGPTGGFLDPGAWTFELHAIGNNGNTKPHALATFSTTF